MLDNVIKNLNLNIIIVKSKNKESNTIELKKLKYSSSLVNSKNNIYILNFFFLLIASQPDEYRISIFKSINVIRVSQSSRQSEKYFINLNFKN